MHNTKVSLLFLALGFRLAKNYEGAKTAIEKASKGQEMLSSYLCVLD